MINNLILAYRSQFYDWNWTQLKSFFRKNRVLLLFLGIFVLAFIGGLIYCIYSRSSVLMAVLFIVESILSILVDRLSVRRYRTFILSKQNHLNDVISFLRTTVPNNDLYNEKQIDEIIQRLTQFIDASAPFKTFKARLGLFGEKIIFPAITFIVGAYATAIGKMDFLVVITLALNGILILAILYMAWDAVSKALQKIICRDYDAAVTFREDLLDIKLLFFSIS